jgi:hypothetical protein
MAQVSINTIKSWFLTGIRPVQENYHDWMDSFWHKDESIPTASVAGLDAILGDTATNTQIDNLQQQIDNLVVAAGREDIFLSSGGNDYIIPEGRLVECLIFTASASTQVEVFETASGDPISDFLCKNTEPYLLRVDIIKNQDFTITINVLNPLNLTVLFR